MATSNRPRLLAAIFGVYFLVVAYFAWTTANQTGWTYGSDLTRWVYTTYMLVSAVFLVGLGGLGVSVRRSFSRQIREIDAKLAGGTMEPTAEALPPPLPDTTTSPAVRDHVDRDIDELLESLSEVEATAAREAQKMEVEATSVPHSSGGEPGDSGLAARRDLLAKRQKLLGRFVAGPGLAAAVILGISGMMLPGSDGYLQSQVALNTALILGIGYSWLGVGGYIAATIAALVSARDGRRKR